MSTMRALTVQTWGEDPVLITVPNPPQPDDAQIQIKVLAAGLPQLVRSQASGKHYSTANASLPYIPGADGVGLASSGEIVYFTCINTGGAFAEYINVPRGAVFPIEIPANTSESEKTKIAIRIAGLVNPAMSSWLAMKTRTTDLPPNFTVLINGVTSLSGQIAISHLRALGAGKIIGTARHEDKLKTLALDKYIVLSDPVESTDFASVLKEHHVDVILDYVYGTTTLHLLSSLPSIPPRAHELETQYIQIGSLGGLEMNLPSAILRSRNLTIRGSGPGAWSVTRDMRQNFPGLLARLVEGVGEYPLVESKLEDIETTWADRKSRSVLTGLNEDETTSIGFA